MEPKLRPNRLRKLADDRGLSIGAMLTDELAKHGTVKERRTKSHASSFVASSVMLPQGEMMWLNDSGLAGVATSTSTPCHVDQGRQRHGRQHDRSGFGHRGH